MQIAPISVLATYPVPNYIDPERRGPAALILGLVLGTIATIIIIVRLYARRWLTRGFGLDDILIILAYLPAVAFTTLGIVSQDRLQWNRHVWDVELQLLTPALQISLVTLVLFDLSTSLIKLSMLALTYRLVAASKDKTMKLVVLGLAVVISINGFIFIFVTIFQCRPVSDYWTFSFQPQNCINEGAHLLAANIINTTTDFFVVLLPIKICLGLELPRRERVAVVGLFGLGLLASFAGIARTVFARIMTSAADHDYTWRAWPTFISSVIELFVGLICSSIPATKPFFASYLPGVIGSTLRSHRSTLNTWDGKRPFASIASSRNLPGAEGPQSSMFQWPQSPLTVNLNKPLPPVRADALTSHPTFPDPTAEPGVGGPRYWSWQKKAPNRAGGIRLSDGSVVNLDRSRDHESLDRTTVVIMYQDDDVILSKSPRSQQTFQSGGFSA